MALVSIDMELQPDEQTALAAAIRSTRTAAGLSQLRLGELAGLGQDKISRYETRRNEPGLAALFAIDRACGRPAGTVLRRAGLIDDLPPTTEELLKADRDLRADDAESLIRFYSLAVGRD